MIRISSNSRSFWRTSATYLTVRYRAGGWLAAECGVGAVVIVGVQPGGELGAAFDVAAVEPDVGPFVGQGAVEAFHLAVCFAADTVEFAGTRCWPRRRRTPAIHSKSRCLSTLFAQ